MRRKIARAILFSVRPADIKCHQRLIGRREFRQVLGDKSI